MKIAIKRNSMTHVALQYLKMKKTWVTENHLYDLAPTKYKCKSHAKESLNRLVKLGYASYNSFEYKITDDGISALPFIVNQQPRASALNDSIIV